MDFEFLMTQSRNIIYMQDDNFMTVDTLSLIYIDIQSINDFILNNFQDHEQNQRQHFSLRIQRTRQSDAARDRKEKKVQCIIGGGHQQCRNREMGDE